MRFFAVLILLAFAACEGTPVNTNAGNIFKDSVTGLPQFYPIPSFVQDELKYLEEFPSGIMRHITYQNKMDSGYIPLDSIKPYAALFESVDLNKPGVRKKVKESSFLDQTVNLVTLNYEIAAEDIPLSRVVVTIKKGDVTDVVNSIYIEKSIELDGQQYFLKLYWKSHKSCMIVEQWIDAAGAEHTRQTNLEWNIESQ